jgi:hypothetical protein
MKIHLVGDELFHADKRTDKHDEANSRFSQFCKGAYKISVTVIQNIIISKNLNDALWMVSKTNPNCTSKSVCTFLAFGFSERDLLTLTEQGCADKSLARPGRTQATAT